MRFAILMAMVVPVVAVEFGVSTYMSDSMYDGKFDVDVTRMGVMLDIMTIKENTPVSFSIGLGSCEINNIDGIEARAIVRIYGNIGLKNIKPFVGLGGAIIWNDERLMFLSQPQTIHEFETINTYTVLVDSYTIEEREEMSRVNYSGFFQLGILIDYNDFYTRFGVEYSHISNGGREHINASMDTIGWFAEIGYTF